MKNWEALKALQEGKKVWRGESFSLLSPKSCWSQIFDYDDGWELYEEPGHDWAWACKQLKDGYTVQRRGQFPICANGFGVVAFAERFGKHACFELSDFYATDWVLAGDRR